MKQYFCTYFFLAGAEVHPLVWSATGKNDLDFGVFLAVVTLKTPADIKRFAAPCFTKGFPAVIVSAKPWRISGSPWKAWPSFVHRSCHTIWRVSRTSCGSRVCLGELPIRDDVQNNPIFRSVSVLPQILPTRLNVIFLIAWKPNFLNWGVSYNENFNALFLLVEKVLGFPLGVHTTLIKT